MGQFEFASPDFPMGGSDYAHLAGIEEDSPWVTGPAVGGFADTTDPGTTGLAHVNAGQAPNGNPAARQQHWSNLFDWRNGPMFWIALGTILYFGLLSLHVSSRVGRTGVNFRTGR